MSLTLRLLALAPVMVASFTCVLWVDAQDAVEGEAKVEKAYEGEGTEILPEQMEQEQVSATSMVSPLVSQLQPSSEWPEAGKVPEFQLLDYPGVTAAVHDLLSAKYEAWLSYLGTGAEPQTLPQNLLQSSGCMEPCDMHKSLLVVNPEEKRVYVAMVDNGHVLMRPSLMSWPDEAITPLKRWLASSTPAE